MKTVKKIIVFPMLLFIALFSCSSGDSGGGTIPDTTQTNLVINAEVVGTSSQLPNGNGTGVVNFNIVSNNATSFKVVFGDGETLETTTGVFTHTYALSGTKSFEIQVSAFNGLKYFNTTKSITVFVATTQIWADEFDIDGAPNSSKWGYDLGAGGWGNNEAEYYTNRSDNVIVQGGLLKIISKKESYQGSSYTSARLLSKGKFSFKYGKVEFRAKFPTGAGTWPAVWMLGDNIGTVSWPACGEVDILEEVGNQLNVNHSSLHSPGRSGNTPDTATVSVLNGNTEFHTYTMDWRSDFIKFYVDNQLYYTFTNSASMPFNQNFFLIINSAMGGNFGGAIDPNFVSSTFEVDYIRVYN
jgi:beta-glucanase (GH16 family)